MRNSERLRILIVDGGFLYRKTLSEALHSFGQVDVACDGREAVFAIELGLASRQRYQLIAVDADIRNRTAGQVVEYLRRRERDQDIPQEDSAKVIGTTRRPIVTGGWNRLAATFDALLVKPVQAERLYEEMQRLELLPADHKMHESDEVDPLSGVVATDCWRSFTGNGF